MNENASIKKKLNKNGDQRRPIRIKFCDLFPQKRGLYTAFVSRWLTGRFREVILAVGTSFSRRCREVKMRVNVWTDRRDQSKRGGREHKTSKGNYQSTDQVGLKRFCYECTEMLNVALGLIVH